MRLLVGLLMLLASFASMRAEGAISIEALLKSGWQIAGYTAAGDNRSTFILFRHPERTHLVTCRVGYDVTRSPRTYVKLRYRVG